MCISVLANGTGQLDFLTPPCSVHGGSAANVLKGLGNLALQQRSARFMGMVGLDDAGRYMSPAILM